jgi:hypothetical protein
MIILIIKLIANSAKGKAVITVFNITAQEGSNKLSSQQNTVPALCTERVALASTASYSRNLQVEIMSL